MAKSSAGQLHKLSSVSGRLQVIEDDNSALRECPICAKQFLRPSHVKRHLASHSSSGTFLCTVCNRNFKQKAHLKRHALLVHADLLDPVVVGTAKRCKICKCCGKSFSDVWMLKRHCRTIHSGAGLDTSQTTFHCEHCGRKNFQSEKHLTNHLQRHMGLRPYACAQCGLAFRRSSELDNHYAAKHSALAPSWHCRLCDDVFVQRIQVERHWKRRHLTPNAVNADPCPSTITCRHCYGVVSSNKELQDHIAQAHFYRSSPCGGGESPNLHCKLVLIVDIASDSKPVDKLLLHNSLPFNLLRQFDELTVCQVNLPTLVQPGRTIVLELDVQYSQGCYGSTKAAYRIVYRQ